MIKTRTTALNIGGEKRYQNSKAAFLLSERLLGVGEHINERVPDRYHRQQRVELN